MRCWKRPTLTTVRTVTRERLTATAAHPLLNASPRRRRNTAKEGPTRFREVDQGAGVTVRRGEAPSPRRNAGGDEAARARLTKREVDPVPLTGGEVDPALRTRNGAVPALRTRNGAAPALRTGNGVGPALPIEGGVAHVHHTGNGVGPAPREDPAGLSHLTGSAAVLRSRSGTASATSGDTRADETSPPPQNQIHLLLDVPSPPLRTSRTRTGTGALCSACSFHSVWV